MSTKNGNNTHWQNRIIEVEHDVDPWTLNLHPDNYRIHPWHQRATMTATLTAVGWIDGIKASKKTRNVIDGHMRVEEARDHGETVPVLWLELTEQEEKKALATYHPAGSMARTDPDAYNRLLASAKIDTNFLKQMARGVGEAAAAAAAKTQAKKQEPPPAPTYSAPDTVYPTNNPYDIPILHLDRQADAADVPIMTWGSKRRSTTAGTIHFYTEDYRFSALWKDPGKLLDANPITAVEPNYSLHQNTPAAEAIYRTYQKRYMARYWQEAGIRLFVDLNVHPKHREINLIGVPDGWTAYATRAYTGLLNELKEEIALAESHAGGKILFLVYGGGGEIEEYAKANADRGVIWIAERADQVKGIK